jgi:hypothetical protein
MGGTTGEILYDGVVETSYGQFDLVWSDEGGFDGDADVFFAGQVNGLAGAGSPLGVYAHLARWGGGSAVRIVRLDSEPALDDAWEDVVEVSTVVPDGAEPAWLAWAGEDGGQLDLAPATYRLRVSARGRDAGAEDEFADGIVDTYLLELWPAPAAPDAILRTTSENAAYWHREWGGRR